MLSKKSKLEFLHLFVAFLQEVYFPKGIQQKSFPYEVRAILAKILMSENLFITVVYEAVPMQTLLEIPFNLGHKKSNFLSIITEYSFNTFSLTGHKGLPGLKSTS